LRIFLWRSQREGILSQTLPQPSLFVDTSEDAIRDTVRGLGGAKVVGPLIWRSKPPGRAERDLLDCMNPNNPRELSFDEILLIGRLGREAGIHLLAGFVNMELGYAPPIPIDPTDEKAELQRQYIASVEEQKRINARMERLAK
jgi:hypothetical protein